MKRSVVFTATLAALLAILAPDRAVQAQGHPNAKGSRPPMSSGPGVSGPGASGPDYYSDEFTSGDYFPGGCSSGQCGSGPCDSGACCSSDYCGYDCCDDCAYGCGSGDSWWDCLGLGDNSRWFFTADYLYVRANFSEAVAYIQRDQADAANRSDVVHELDFQYESSYRLGGGYQLGCCDEEIRFMFTRMSSFADTVTPLGTVDMPVLVPYEATSPDGPTFISADVDTKSFDLDYRKTIPLGGTQCGGCGDACCDPCGCGDACCPPSCPAWDITWSGGVRFADVDWQRQYTAVDDNFEQVNATSSTLDFSGGGPRVGLEGRRYIGASNWCSLYLKGDISLLLGHMQQQIIRVDQNGLITSLTDRGRRIVPVTEIEAGGSVRFTKNAMFSNGYLFSAWHDLGFRDQFDLQTLVESNTTDTANILGFDGFFARLEIGF